ncbi:MAG: DUF971 domain-containing protein [Candidatus Binatia bacterium]
MTPSQNPVEIRRLGTRAVRIVWADGHASEYVNRYLREHCPCAACRLQPRQSLPVLGSEEDLYPVQVAVVGRYALSVEWSDGHDSGIYSYRTLREICPCAECHTAVAAAS